MKYLIAMLVVFIGLYNMIYLGFMGKTNNARNLEIKNNNPSMYKWTRIILGALTMIIGISVIIEL